MNILTERQRQTFLDKINRTDDPDGCWEWTGSLSHGGYGQYTVRLTTGERKNLRTHRVAYEMFVGPIGDGLELDHLCRNPKCCRPEHLEMVPHVVNIRRRPAFKTNGGRPPKLSAAEKASIRMACNRWGDQTKLAQQYGVDVSTICRIVGRRQMQTSEATA